MELGTIATVTTAHMTEEVAKVLNSRFQDGESIDDSAHWINDLQWAGFEYGWLLSIASDRFDERKPEFAENEQIPKCILEIAIFAKKRGARWICFDSDGPEAEGVTTYDW